MHRTARALAVAAATTLALAATTTTASAELVADYEMEEPFGAQTMVDSVNGYNGTIGDKVTTGRDAGGGYLAHSFPGPFSGFDPGRINTVLDEVGGAQPDVLDPETSEYAVTIRFRTTATRPNIVQKGQNGQNGGFWKLVLKSGWPRCHFEDATGTIKAVGFVNQGDQYKVNDGQWHTLRCERLSTGVRVTLDYGRPNAVTRFNRGTLGTINNKHPLMVGGKLYCPEGAILEKNGREVNCDYYVGQLDWVTIEKGAPLLTTPLADRLY